MFKNYFKTAWRNFSKNKSYGIINILGLTMGLAAVLLIVIWIWDELSFNKHFKNYDRIAMVMQQRVDENGVGTGNGMPVPLSAAIRDGFKDEFSHVALHFTGEYNLTTGDKKFSENGMFAEATWPEIFSLDMISGSRTALTDPSSVLITRSLAYKLFGSTDVVNKVITITGTYDLKVAGVYNDLPSNAEFSDISFIAPFGFFISNWDWVKNEKDNWQYSIFSLTVQTKPGVDVAIASQKIKQVLAPHVVQDKGEKSKRSLLLYPMSRWHLYDNFDEQGKNTGGAIQFVWLFGAIAFFILLLACINFMNLSTARSQKRAKEVGIRKAAGSTRAQLIIQFFTESILTVLASFVLALMIVWIALPWYNGLTQKHLNLQHLNPVFWAMAFIICLVTGLIAGSYPALYLSSFKPIKVLKGLFKAGPAPNILRKSLVVFQFSISIFLIIATVVIYQQIQHGKDRPVGYDRNGLLSVQMTTGEIYANYNALRNELIASGMVVDLAQSQCPVTQIWVGDNGFEWKGKDPNEPDGFSVVAASHEYGKVVGWQFTQGRGFSKDLVTDSMGLILNESAVKAMRLQKPVGEIIKWHGKDHTVLGVIKDVVMTSPFDLDRAVIFPLLKEGGNYVVLKLHPGKSLSAAIKAIGAAFEKHNPSAAFEYTFVDDDYAKKFSSEETIGNIGLVFAALAILISLLGLFGIASFIAEQRTKEVGVRKVLGASVANLWGLLSKEMMLLVFLSTLVSIPLVYWAMDSWLYRYSYRVPLYWGIFLLPGLGALLVALLTVSYQTIKAAIANPVKSLRTE